MPASFLVIPTALFLLWIGWFFQSIPDASNLNDCVTATTNDVLLCSKNPRYRKLSSFPKHLIDALLVSEDVNFYHHKGFDWSEILNSLEVNLESGEYTRGGSTLTQQLVKNVYLAKEKTLVRKFREALVTYQVENTFDKKIILEKYLNVVELGNNIYGFPQAAQVYFQKSPSELSLLQAVYLVHLLPNPKVYSRTYYKKKLTPFSHGRMKTILNRLHKYKKIAEVQATESILSLDQFPWMWSAEPAQEEETNPLEANENEVESSDTGSDELSESEP